MEIAAKSRKHGFNDGRDWTLNPGSALWQPGWTHYGTVGQTTARLHTMTREVDIMDGNEWVRCDAGTDVFFTPTSGLPETGADREVPANHPG